MAYVNTDNSFRPMYRGGEILVAKAEMLYQQEFWDWVFLLIQIWFRVWGRSESIENSLVKLDEIS